MLHRANKNCEMHLLVALVGCLPPEPELWYVQP